MGKGLKALEKIKQATYSIDFELSVCVGEDYKKEINIIEKELERLDDLLEMLYKMNVKHGYKEYLKIIKALEIIKETPIFAWYITIYKDAYEMVSDAKGFRVNNSVEELQQMFDLLKEVFELL